LDYLRDLSRELKVDGLVEFTGRVSEAQLWETLGSSDVCVNPDRVNDMNDKSTMNKILEYMALGKPIVQFQLTEGRVSAGAASEYAAPNDPLDFAKKLCDLLDDPSRREEMGRIGKLRVEGELAWRHQVPRLLAAYEKAFS
jgi:glycosyltransferase involved in cell wall biosynthesis